MEGFFADPMYGGNRDKVGWKMIGFPGVDRDLLRTHQDLSEQDVRRRADEHRSILS